MVLIRFVVQICRFIMLCDRFLVFKLSIRVQFIFAYASLDLVFVFIHFRASLHAR